MGSTKTMLSLGGGWQFCSLVDPVVDLTLRDTRWVTVSFLACVSHVPPVTCEVQRPSAFLSVNAPKSTEKKEVVIY